MVSREQTEHHIVMAYIVMASREQTEHHIVMAYIIMALREQTEHRSVVCRYVCLHYAEPLSRAEVSWPRLCFAEFYYPAERITIVSSFLYRVSDITPPNDVFNANDHSTAFGDIPSWLIGQHPSSLPQLSFYLLFQLSHYMIVSLCYYQSLVVVNMTYISVQFQFLLIRNTHSLVVPSVALLG